jgi:hypothetical protein
MTTSDELVPGVTRADVEVPGWTSERTALSRRAQRARQQFEVKRRPRAEAAIAAARAEGYGPDTPPGKRGPVIYRLQGEGCYLAEIGDLFGIAGTTAGIAVSAYRKREGLPSRRVHL